GRDLRIGALTAHVQHEMPGDRKRASVSGERAHDVEHEIESRRDAGAGVALAVDDEQAVLQYLRLRRQCGQLRALGVMRGAGEAVQQPGPRSEQGARANGHKSVSGTNAGPQPVDDLLFILAHLRLTWILAEGNLV